MISLLTKSLIDKSEGIITIQPEVRDNENHGYLMFDDGGVEVEVGEFIYGLTKILKPHRALTTGIYTGISDMYISQAMIENGYGHITALEFEIAHKERAEKLWLKTGTAKNIDAMLTDSRKFQPNGVYELMFLDTEPQQRFQELINFYPYLAEGGFVFMHDLANHMGQETIEGHEANWPWGKLPDEIVNWVKTGELIPWYFPNPRGLVGLRKKMKGLKPDYESK